MRPRAIGDYLVDVASIGLAAAITIIVVGLALDSPVIQPAYNVPLLGPVLSGIKSAWQHIYDPQTV
jgi:hypothetical protein